MVAIVLVIASSHEEANLVQFLKEYILTYLYTQNCQCHRWRLSVIQVLQQKLAKLANKIAILHMKHTTKFSEIVLNL